MNEHDLQRFLARPELPRSRLTAKASQVGFVVGSGSSNMLYTESATAESQLVVTQGDMVVGTYLTFVWCEQLALTPALKGFAADVRAGGFPKEDECVEHHQDAAFFGFTMGETAGHTLLEKGGDKVVYVPMNLVLARAGELIRRKLLIVNARYFPAGFAELFKKSMRDALKFARARRHAA